MVIGKELRKRLKSELFPARAYTWAHHSNKNANTVGCLCRVGSLKKEPNCGSDKMCEKLITRKVFCFPVSKLDALDSILDALDSSLDTRSFRVSRIELRSSSFKGLSTCICTVLYFNSFHLSIATYTHKVNSIQYWIQLCQLTLSYFIVSG